MRLVDLAADRVDWERTNRYAATVRENHYIETQAEKDYAVLSSGVTQTLNEVALTTDPARRLDIVERARRALAEWPAEHFNYRMNEIRQMLGMLDEAIADLRSTSKTGKFDIALTAFSNPPGTPEPLLPRPTAKDAIEQTLLASRLAESPAERVSLLNDALKAIDTASAELPAAWVATMRADARGRIAAEQQIDREYVALTRFYVAAARQRASVADVHGVERLVNRIQYRDAALGKRRPQSVNALIAAVRAELDAAQRLRLARDRWNLRLPEMRQYYTEMALALRQLSGMRLSLEAIKSLSGSTPATLAALDVAAAEIVRVAAAVHPPEELRSAHAQVVSAAQLAANAARIRREATLAGDMSRAWDASSAAAGALMLGSSARKEIVRQLNVPRLP